MLTNFRTKHMNEWVRSSSVWIQDETFLANQSEEEPSPKAKCWGGLDLASVSDVTALNLVWPNEDGGYLTRSWYWLPEEAIARRLATSGSHIYETFESLDNVFVTEGNVTDYDAIRRFLTGFHIEGGVVGYDKDTLATRYNVEAIAFDRYNSSQLVLNLAADGLDLQPYGQGLRLHVDTHQGSRTPHGRRQNPPRRRPRLPLHVGERGFEDRPFGQHQTRQGKVGRQN